MSYRIRIQADERVWLDYPYGGPNSMHMIQTEDLAFWWAERCAEAEPGKTFRVFQNARDPYPVGRLFTYVGPAIPLPESTAAYDEWRRMWLHSDEYSEAA